MKGYIWIPVALLVGLVVGALGPKSELRAAKDEMERLKAGEKRRTRMEEISRILQLPQGEARPTAVPRRAGPPAAGSNAVAAAEAPSATNAASGRVVKHWEFRIGHAPEEAADGNPADQTANAGADGKTMRERIEEAAALWRVRSDIARNTFIGNAGLTPEQAAEFDTVVAGMNVRLRDRIGAWAGNIVQTNSVGPETGIRMINDLTGVLALTYDEMDRNLPKGWRQRAGDGLNLTEFIDPSVAEPLIGVEGKLAPPAGGGAAAAQGSATR